MGTGSSPGQALHPTTVGMLLLGSCRRPAHIHDAPGHGAQAGSSEFCWRSSTKASRTELFLKVRPE
eukprot:5490927-Alexandrium_andersonii.AAC.2